MLLQWFLIQDRLQTLNVRRYQQLTSDSSYLQRVMCCMQKIQSSFNSASALDCRGVQKPHEMVQSRRSRLTALNGRDVAVQLTRTAIRRDATGQRRRAPAAAAATTATVGLHIAHWPPTHIKQMAKAYDVGCQQRYAKMNRGRVIRVRRLVTGDGKFREIFST